MPCYDHKAFFIGEKNMFMTTAGRTDQELVQRAQALARQLDIPFVARRKRSVKATQEAENGDDCIVFGKNRLELHRFEGGEPFFFHPNLAMVRIKRIVHGESDPFLVAGDIETGSSILDCTLGLGADAIVASFAVGKSGKVLALEDNRFIALIVSHGLHTWEDGDDGMIAAMRRVEVKQIHHYEALKQMADHSYDVVYFDPMFEESIVESDGIRTLTHFAIAHPLTEKVIYEAKRVARKRVVLKDHLALLY
jgi:16S rRNA G966 N2-methylase RsmD